MRDALLLAERQVHIIGWDIHSETPLVGPSGRVDDGLPVALGPFLTGLLEAKPDLRINILIWDFAALYAVEREWNSADKFMAAGKGRIRFCLDSSLPLGSSQHQKIVVIDNAVAFSGGLDLTIRRWDTSEHLADHPLRRDPEGKPYPPFHDVQCMVEGEAAAALGEIAAARWAAAGCTMEACDTVEGDRWPASVPAGARQIQAAHRADRIANRVASGGRRGGAAVRGLDQCGKPLHLHRKPVHQRHRDRRDAGAADGRRAGAARSDRDAEGAFVVAGIAGHAVAAAAVFWTRSSRPGSPTGCAFSIRPCRMEQSSAAVMVHSKVMIVDDGFLRVGSANLNNRSMGADTECDLAFEAEGEAHREFIRGLRRRLIGHFCGVDEATIAANEDDLLGFIDRHAASGAGRALLPIDCETTPAGAMVDLIQPIADPKHPLNLQRTARRMWTARTVLAVAGTAAALAGLALAWQTTSLRDFTDIGYVASVIARHSQSALAPLFAVAAFVLGGLVVFPVVVLIAATAAALGPWIGAFSATAGVLASSLVLFMIGRFLGHKRLQSLLGARALRVQRRIVGKGVVAVAMIRMVPVAPFSLVNVLAGASQLRLTDFLIGTVIGMAPGIITMAALGAQIADFAKNASWSNALPLGLTIALWIAVCLAVQFVVTWWSGRRA